MDHMIWGVGLSKILGIVFPSNGMAWQEIFLRWIHFLAGITWIGMLYFFNLVNVNLMKALDAPTKGKVIPELMPRALFWFRWGAVVTVLVGLWYYVIILSREPSAGANFGRWLGMVVVAWILIFLILRPVSGALNNGYLIALLVAILMILLGWGVLRFNAAEETSNRALSIGIGGGMGVIMLLNVWGIIWPHQKRIIAWTKANATAGTPMPPEAAKMARRSFLASRMNTWLSLPMLFFMAAASHFPFLGK